MPVDAVSIYKEDKLHKFAFNSQYGYPARILDLTYKYAMLGQKKMNAAIVHFLKKSTLRYCIIGIFHRHSIFAIFSLSMIAFFL